MVSRATDLLLLLILNALTSTRPLFIIRLTMANTMAPTQASPARSVIVPDFASVAGNLGFTATGLTRWKSLLANLLGQRAEAYTPSAIKKPLNKSRS